MSGRFHCYRRRRVLPFAAVSALVFINAATLAPLVAPPDWAAEAMVDDAASAATSRDISRDLRYDRGRHMDREPVVVAAPPPLVKNLRRPAPTRQTKATTCGAHYRPAASRCTKRDFSHGLVAATDPDLSRLCRLLL